MFLLHVCSSDPSSVKPIKNNMKYLKSAAITLVGYWFSRLKTFWTGDEGALINTGSWKNPWWLLAGPFGEGAPQLRESCQHVSEEQVRILNTVPRKFGAAFNGQRKAFRTAMICFKLSGIHRSRSRTSLQAWQVSWGTSQCWRKHPLYPVPLRFCHSELLECRQDFAPNGVESLLLSPQRVL